MTRGKEPRYFQEAAIRAAILRTMRGQKRILLTLATGTGKTFIAMQIAWKLLKSGWLQAQKGHSGRILFLADRVVLRDQAYNAFSPFAASHSGDPRFLLDGKRKLSLQHDLYFAIYQTLWNEEKSKRLFEHFSPDFFDLVIVDEAHRFGFGTWREILDHFGGALHLWG